MVGWHGSDILPQAHPAPHRPVSQAGPRCPQQGGDEHVRHTPDILTARGHNSDMHVVTVTLLQPMHKSTSNYTAEYCDDGLLRQRMIVRKTCLHSVTSLVTSVQLL